MSFGFKKVLELVPTQSCLSLSSIHEVVSRCCRLLKQVNKVKLPSGPCDYIYIVSFFFINFFYFYLQYYLQKYTIHYITYTTRTTYNTVPYYVFFPFYTHTTREK